MMPMTASMATKTIAAVAAAGTDALLLSDTPADGSPGATEVGFFPDLGDWETFFTDFSEGVFDSFWVGASEGLLDG